MSALGQKRTFCDAGAMSALPPKADIREHRLKGPLCANSGRWTGCYVRFVPEITAHVVRRTKLGLSSFTECTPHCCMAARVSVRNNSSTRSTPSWPNAPRPQR